MVSVRARGKSQRNSQVGSLCWHQEAAQPAPTSRCRSLGSGLASVPGALQPHRHLEAQSGLRAGFCTPQSAAFAVRAGAAPIPATTTQLQRCKSWIEPSLVPAAWLESCPRSWKQPAWMLGMWGPQHPKNEGTPGFPRTPQCCPVDGPCLPLGQQRELSTWHQGRPPGRDGHPKYHQTSPPDLSQMPHVPAAVPRCGAGAALGRDPALTAARRAGVSRARLRV